MVEDDFVEYLALQAKSGVSAVHQYRLHASDSTAQVHVFLEGDDDALFYLPEIRARSGERDVIVYICGGKRGVLEALSTLQSDGYDLTSALFFVDRDFADYLGSQMQDTDGLYTTEYYSIESYLVSARALEVMLVDVGRMSKSDPAYTDCINRWGKEYKQFCTAIRPIMAWCLAMRSAAKKPNFNNVDLGKVLEFAEGRWKRSQSGFQNFVRASVRKEDSVTCSSLRTWLPKLATGNEKNWLRGKYELWFFETFLLGCLTQAGAKAKRWKVPSALRERRLMDVLGGRLSCPSSCAAFLDTRIGPRH